MCSVLSFFKCPKGLQFRMLPTVAEMGADIASTRQSYLCSGDIVGFFFGLSGLLTLCPLRCFYCSFQIIYQPAKLHFASLLRQETETYRI